MFYRTQVRQACRRLGDRELDTGFRRPQLLNPSTPTVPGSPTTRNALGIGPAWREPSSDQTWGSPAPFPSLFSCRNGKGKDRGGWGHTCLTPVLEGNQSKREHFPQAQSHHAEPPGFLNRGSRGSWAPSSVLCEHLTKLQRRRSSPKGLDSIHLQPAPHPGELLQGHQVEAAFRC